MYWLYFVLVLSLGAYGAAVESPVGNSETYKRETDVRNGDRKTSSDESLRRLMESLLERIEIQNNRLQQLELLVRNNEEDLKRKEIRIDQLERELKSVSKQSEDCTDKLPEHVSDLNRHLDNPKNDISATTSKMKPFRKLTDEQPSRVVRVTPNGAGAFSVSLSERDVNLLPNLVIVFDEVLLDMDGHYHPGDGVYTVPVSGVYVFTWQTTGTTTDNVVTELVINGASRGTIFSDAETGHTWDSTTGVIVTSVNVGDHVFIRSKSRGILHSSRALGKALFSGWRLT